MNRPPIDPPLARLGDGTPIGPGHGVIPILKEIGTRKLKVIGTGFYVTRYGLVCTAKHVAEDLAEPDGTSLSTCYVCHLVDDGAVHLRRIRKAFLLRTADIAILQADNFLEKFPSNPLMNLRAHLSMAFPSEGAPVITYGTSDQRIQRLTMAGSRVAQHGGRA